MSRAGFVLILATAVTFAGDPNPSADLAPRKVTFSQREVPLDQVLKLLEKETGNAVADCRTKRDNPMLKLPTAPMTFWQTLDALGLGFSAYQPDGGVALVDHPYRKTATHYSGLFRFALKRTLVSRDEETAAHQCQVTLDAAWEPRLELLYLNLEKGNVQFGGMRESLPRQAARSVAGMSAAEIELRMNAPPRTVAQLDSLSGELRAIGTPKMLEFTFPKVAIGGKAAQEGVKVAVLGLTKTSKRWTVTIRIEYPPGAIIPLESYQSWLDNNRVWLHGPNDRRYFPEPTEELRTQIANGVEIEYAFLAGKTALPTADVPITLHYRTPNRVQAYVVPFEFREVRLP